MLTEARMLLLLARVSLEDPCEGSEIQSLKLSMNMEPNPWRGKMPSLISFE